MPQLDIITYQTQFVWLCLFLVLIYILNSIIILPRVYTLVTVRKSFQQILRYNEQKFEFLAALPINKYTLSFCLRNSLSFIFSVNLILSNNINSLIFFSQQVCRFLLLSSRFCQNCFVSKLMYRQLLCLF